MASKRKQGGCTAVRRVMEAINKIGCEVNEFFERARHVVDVPPGFNATKAALQFNHFRAHGPADPPGYQVPACILEFAETIHAADCPLKFYAGLRTQARMNAKGLASGVTTKMQSDPMMRPAPGTRRQMAAYG